MTRAVEHKMDKTRKLQFDIIEKVESSVIRWAAEKNIKIENIEIVVPFVDDEYDLHVVVFFPTNSELDIYRQDGTTTRVEEKYISSLKHHEYPEAWIEQVTLEFDSKENVDVNYEGSYFYRMR